MRRTAAAIANTSFILRRINQSVQRDSDVKSRWAKLGAQIFYRCRDPEHSEDENGEVINRHREHHAGTHGSHIHRHELAPTSTVQLGTTIGKKWPDGAPAPSRS